MIYLPHYDRFQHTYDSTLETYIRNHKKIDGSIYDYNIFNILISS